MPLPRKPNALRSSLPDFSAAVLEERKEVNDNKAFGKPSVLQIVEEASPYKRLVEDLETLLDRLSGAGGTTTFKALGKVQTEVDNEFEVRD